MTGKPVQQEETTELNRVHSFMTAFATWPPLYLDWQQTSSLLLPMQAQQAVLLPTFYSEDTPASANETWARLHSDPLFAVSPSSLHGSSEHQHLSCGCLANTFACIAISPVVDAGPTCSRAVFEIPVVFFVGMQEVDQRPSCRLVFTIYHLVQVLVMQYTVYSGLTIVVGLGCRFGSRSRLRARPLWQILSRWTTSRQRWGSKWLLHMAQAILLPFLVYISCSLTVVYGACDLLCCMRSFDPEFAR